MSLAKQLELTTNRRRQQELRKEIQMLELIIKKLCYQSNAANCELDVVIELNLKIQAQRKLISRKDKMIRRLVSREGILLRMKV